MRTRLSPEHQPAISPSTACKLTVSGSISLPSRGTFHLSLTVLVHYRSPSVFSLGEWTPQIPAGLACPAVLRYLTGGQSVFAYGTITLFGWLSHTILLTDYFVTPMCQTLQPQSQQAGLVWAASHFARHYSGNNLFSSGYLDVSVLQVPFAYLYIQLVMLLVRNSGFPHSEIPGSKPVHGSPRLIAVTHVLHRHLAPRHPP